METAPENSDTSFSDWSSSASSGGWSKDDAIISSNIDDGDVASANGDSEAYSSSDAIRKMVENDDNRVNPSQRPNNLPNTTIISPVASSFSSQNSSKFSEIHTSNLPTFSSHKFSTSLQNADHELGQPLTPESLSPLNAPARSNKTHPNSTSNKCSAEKCDGATFQHSELNCNCLELILPLPPPTNESKSDYIENSDFEFHKNLSTIPLESEPSPTSNPAAINDFPTNKSRKSRDQSYPTTEAIYHEHEYPRSQVTLSPERESSNKISKSQSYIPSGYGSKSLPDGTSVLVNYEKLLQNEAIKRILLQRSVHIYERTVGDLVRECEDSRVLLQGFEERRKKDAVEIESLRDLVQKLETEKQDELNKSQSSLLANEEKDSSDTVKKNGGSRAHTISSPVSSPKQPQTQVTSPVSTTKIITKVKMSRKIISLKLLLVICIMWLAVMNVSVHTSVVKKMVEHQEVENVARRNAFLRGRGLDMQSISVADNDPDAAKDMNSEYIAAEEIARQTEKTFNTRGDHIDESIEEIDWKVAYDEKNTVAIEGIDARRKIDRFKIDQQIEEMNEVKEDASGNNTKIEHDGLVDFTMLQNKAVTTQQTASIISMRQQQVHAIKSRSIDINHNHIGQVANSSIMTGVKFNVDPLRSIHNTQRNEQVISSEHNMTSQSAKLQNYSKFVNGTATHVTSLDGENDIQSIPKMSLALDENRADSEFAKGNANGTEFDYAKNYYSNNETSRHISTSGNKTSIRQPLQSIHFTQRNEKVISSEHNMTSQSTKFKNHSNFVNSTAVHIKSLDRENGIQSIPKLSLAHDEPGSDSKLATGYANGTAFNYVKNYYSNNETSRRIPPSGNKTTIDDEAEPKGLRGFAIQTSR